MGRHATNTDGGSEPVNGGKRAILFAVLDAILVGVAALVFYHLANFANADQTTLFVGLVGVSAFTATFFTICALAVDDAL